MHFRGGAGMTVDSSNDLHLPFFQSYGTGKITDYKALTYDYIVSSERDDAPT
jgi:hypothetical protein